MSLPVRFRPMTPAETRAEAERRLRAPTKGGENWGYMFLSVVVGGFLAGPAPLLFWVAILAGVYFGIRGVLWLLNRPIGVSPDAVAARMGTQMTGPCPACQQPVMVGLSADAFDWACPLCGAHLRYEAGTVYHVA